MAKRGRKPQGEYANKIATISTRVTADLRQALQQARDESGRSLSQEIESRLRRSFDIETNIMDAFGDRRTYAFFRSMGAVVGTLYNPEDPDRFWLDDPYQFEQATRAIKGVLAALRPDGQTELQTDSELLKAGAELQGLERAAYVVEAVRRADPHGWAPADRIRSDLGAAGARIPPLVRVTAKEARAWADQLDKAEQKANPKTKRRGK